MKVFRLFPLVAILSLASCAGGTKAKFEPYVIDSLEQRPDFWKVRTSEIIDICRSVRAGRAEVVASTPLGFPVYAVFYGDFSESAPQTNFSAGNSSSTISAYLGDVASRPQTIMLAAGVHGSEPEGTAAAVNLISLFETGKDLKGVERPEFMELASNYRFIILPCVNMDGRSICPDHFHLQPYEVFRACSQGIWKEDGSLVGWKGSKMWFPLPLDKVSFPGGYPNSEGYNIQHDVTPGDQRTAEAKAVMNLMARWRVDFFLNAHSCEYQPHLAHEGNIDTPAHRLKGRELADKVNDELFFRGLRTKGRFEFKESNTINLTSMTNMCSGGLGMTLECSHSYDNIHNPSITYTFEQMMEPVFVALEVAMKEGMVSPLSERN